MSSFVLYTGLLFVPFAPFSPAVKVGLGALLVILGEATFWVGGAIVGAAAMARYRRFLNPRSWFRQRRGSMDMDAG